MPRLRRLVLERLSRYYRLLSEVTAKGPVPAVTSAQIAEALDIDPTQVRKDFASIGLQGMGRVGFDVCEVCRAVRIAVGFDQRNEAVLVGVGNLGGALLAYSGFQRYGLFITAAFDTDKARIGEEIAGCVVKSARGMKAFVEKNEIRLAIVTTPADVSQQVTERLVASGVKAIWNFAPARLVVPPDVLVRNEHISMGLAEIAHYLKG